VDILDGNDGSTVEIGEDTDAIRSERRSGSEGIGCRWNLRWASIGGNGWRMDGAGEEGGARMSRRSSGGWGWGGSGSGRSGVFGRDTGG